MPLKESIKEVLESSSIHGLVYWSTTKGLTKLFWILVVITGFSGAGFLIQQSFQSWQDGPIKTTIETLPISKVSFPNIIVCPPKDTYTNLNFDLQQAENKTVDFDKDSEDMWNEFLRHFYELAFQKHLHTYKQGFKEENQYKNWYKKLRCAISILIYLFAIIYIFAVMQLSLLIENPSKLMLHLVKCLHLILERKLT